LEEPITLIFANENGPVAVLLAGDREFHFPYMTANAEEISFLCARGATVLEKPTPKRGGDDQ